MDPIHPIVPRTSSIPIQPALAPQLVRREERRAPDQQGRNARQPEGERDTEFDDQLEDRLAAASPPDRADEDDDEGHPAHVDISV